jgi:hypothetical protein
MSLPNPGNHERSKLTARVQLEQQGPLAPMLPAQCSINVSMYLLALSTVAA